MSSEEVTGQTGSVLLDEARTGTVPDSQTGGQASASQPPSQPAQQTNTWRDSLPEDLRADPTLGKFNDVGSLAKSYKEIQKMVGADKLVLPKPDAPDAEWQNVYKKLGLPESVDKYEVKLPDGVTADDQFLKSFKEQAHKAGVLPKQAEQLLAWYTGSAKQAGEAQIQAQEAAKSAQVEKEIGALKSEWGDKWGENLHAARLALKEFGGDEMMGYFRESGLGNDPKMIRLLAKIGSALGETKVHGDSEFKLGISSEEAQAKVSAILANPAYTTRGHPDQPRLVQEMAKYQELLAKRMAG